MLLLPSYFNSIKVQLEQAASIDTSLFTGYFNSIKVQLELLQRERQRQAHRFQFHKGTIRTSGGPSRRAAVCHFNSIKVQLEHVELLDAVKLLEFQFHKGTIRTR